MDRPDFDFTKHIDVPDQWIEKALAIPSACQSKPRVILSRRLIAAASVVLVLGLSIALYFSIRNISSPITVAPSPSPNGGSTVASAQEATMETEYPDAPTDPLIIPSVHPTAPAVLPTEPPSTAPTKPFPTAPLSTVQQPPNHSESPTIQPSVPITEPTQPIVVPTLPKPEPTDPPAPTEYSQYETIVVEIIHSLDMDSPEMPAIAAAVTPPFYCCLYDSIGELVGDPDLYSRAHRAQFVIDTVDDQGGYLRYTAGVPVPLATQIDPDVESGYTYRFYDRYGQVWAEGTVYL